MDPIAEAITGEQVSVPTSPLGALAEFYRAFNTRNLELMSENWDSANDVAMDNPLGGIKRGWPAIRAVYETIFGSAARVEVAFWDYTIHETAELFYAVGRERGTLVAGKVKLDLAIRTTRIFRRAGARWRQVHHHGSIEDPDLLRRYQQAVQR